MTTIPSVAEWCDALLAITQCSSRRGSDERSKGLGGALSQSGAMVGTLAPIPCARCGAPLEWKMGAARIRCGYCGARLVFEAGRTLETQPPIAQGGSLMRPRERRPGRGSVVGCVRA